MNAKFYKVGGYVRDAIMGIKSKDIDYSVEADSYEAMRAAIIARGCDIKLEKPEFLTIRAISPNEGGVDFVLCRKEGAYSDGRRPDAVQPGTLLDDLSRRDFTCNAIAMDDAGNLIDPFDGVGAIADKVLRCVGFAENRFLEDRLRLLRAIRFHITKGFTLSAEIRNCLWSVPLEGVSPERIREELNKCFAHNTVQTLEALQKFSELRDAIFSIPNFSLEATLKKR